VAWRTNTTGRLSSAYKEEEYTVTLTIRKSFRHLQNKLTELIGYYSFEQICDCLDYQNHDQLCTLTLTGVYFRLSVVKQAVIFFPFTVKRQYFLGENLREIQESCEASLLLGLGDVK
jgi:hypothetical protein